MFLLLSLTLGCDGDGPLKPGEFEDPAFAKCVEKNLQDYYDNHLIDPDDPERYNKVEMLECYGGGVKGLKGIENMPNMDDLSIVDNEIESLEPLRTLTKLEFLKLSNNKIKDLEPLSGLPVLGSLIIDDNYVEDISPLYGVSSLTMLWLSRNCIDISQLEEIEKRNSNLHFSETTKSSQDPEKCQ